MEKQRKDLSDQVRDAIRASDMSCYQIAKIIHCAESTLSMFLSGKSGLSMEMLDRVAECLRLNITVEKRKKVRP